MAGSRLVIGVITARSVDVPSLADAIFYTVEVDDGAGQPESYANTVPQQAARWSTFDPTLELVPFEVGQRVMVGITTSGSSQYTEIMQSELPKRGPCKESGGAG